MVSFFVPVLSAGSFFGTSLFPETHTFAACAGALARSNEDPPPMVEAKRLLLVTLRELVGFRIKDINPNPKRNAVMNGLRFAIFDAKVPRTVLASRMNESDFGSPSRSFTLGFHGEKQKRSRKRVVRARKR